MFSFCAISITWPSEMAMEGLASSAKAYSTLAMMRGGRAGMLGGGGGGARAADELDVCRVWTGILAAADDATAEATGVAAAAGLEDEAEGRACGVRF